MARQRILDIVEEREAMRGEGKYHGAKKRASAFKEEEGQIQSLVGYLWPPEIYRREKKCEPHENGHVIQTIQGMRCIVLDSSHGTHESVPGIHAYYRNKRAGCKARNKNRIPP